MKTGFPDGSNKSSIMKFASGKRFVFGSQTLPRMIFLSLNKQIFLQKPVIEHFLPYFVCRLNNFWYIQVEVQLSMNSSKN